MRRSNRHSRLVRERLLRGRRNYYSGPVEKLTIEEPYDPENPRVIIVYESRRNSDVSE